MEGYENDVAELAEKLLGVARRILLQMDSKSIPLTPLEAEVMTYVQNRPGVTSSTIAAAIKLKRSNASAALRSLEAKGLIVRTADADDHRCVRVYATAKADADLELLRTAWSQLLTPLLDENARSEVDRVSAFLARLDALLIQAEAGVQMKVLTPVPAAAGRPV